MYYIKLLSEFDLTHVKTMTTQFLYKYTYDKVPASLIHQTVIIFLQVMSIHCKLMEFMNLGLWMD